MNIQDGSSPGNPDKQTADANAHDTQEPLRSFYNLMKDKQKKVLDDFCANLADGKGMSMPEAFENAFGITLEKFYEDFESYRKTW